MHASAHSRHCASAQSRTGLFHHLNQTTWPAFMMVMAHMFCHICKQTTAQVMVLCSTCNSGNHTHTHSMGGTCIPEGDYYCSKGCRQLGELHVGSTIVTESPHPLYVHPNVPHLSQGLCSNAITTLGPVQSQAQGHTVMSLYCAARPPSRTAYACTPSPTHTGSCCSYTGR